MRTLTILVVDDHEDSALALARLLRHKGHHVLAATSFADATATAALAGSIDLLVSDVSLGDGDGCTLLRLLAERRGGGPRHAIAMTGHGEEDWVEECRRAGFQHFLLKPVIFEELCSIIESLDRESAPPLTEPAGPVL